MASATAGSAKPSGRHHDRPARQHAEHDIGVVFARRQVEQQGRAQAERGVHGRRAGFVAALGQAAEAQAARVVDHQRAGQLADSRLRAQVDLHA